MTAVRPVQLFNNVDCVDVGAETFRGKPAAFRPGCARSRLPQTYEIAAWRFVPGKSGLPSPRPAGIAAERYVVSRER